MRASVMQWRRYRGIHFIIWSFLFCDRPGNRTIILKFRRAHYGKENRKNNFSLYKIFIYVALLTLAIGILVPVLWVFMASVKENAEFHRNPWALPASSILKTL